MAGCDTNLAARVRKLFLESDAGREQVPVFAAMPDSVLDGWADFFWSTAALFSLSTPVHEVALAELEWTLDVPFWRVDDKLFAVTPREVIAQPEKAPEHETRILQADCRFPISLFRSGGRLLVLDGYHRIARARMDGLENLPARTVTRKDLPDILIQEGFLGALNDLRQDSCNVKLLLRSVARDIQADETSRS